MGFNKEKFADLLNTAKGRRSINQYAADSDVTSAHISRLLRSLLDTPPSPQTIRKLADSAENDITYFELMAAAGHLQESEERNKRLEALTTFLNEVELQKQIRDKAIRDLDIANEDISEREKELRDLELLESLNKKYGVYQDIEPLGQRAEIPIIGTVTAGPNGIAFQEYLGTELTDIENLNGGECYWIRVKGDSMTGEGIFENDLALFRVQPEVLSGELAIVVVNGEEGTIKRVYFRDNSIVLQSSNPAYPPRIFVGKDTETVRIVGKVKEIKRKF